MKMKRRRVVITGLGLVSALGEDLASFWQSLLDIKTGIKKISSLSDITNPWCWGGEFSEFDALKHINPKQKKLMKVMSRDIQLSVVAAKLAIQDAGLLNQNVDRARMGISIGASLINNDLDEIGAGYKAASENGRLNEARFGDDGMDAMPPLWMLKYLPNMPACHISIGYDLQGPSNTITTEGAASLQAIGEGLHVIQRGAADCMAVGGVDSKTNTVAISKYELLGIYPPAGDSPEDIYQPFNSKVSGILPGEAANILILEEREHALRRNAPIYAEVLGYGTAPIYDYLPNDSKDVEGRLIALRAALKDACIKPSDLDFIYAHGFGISAVDQCEAAALKELLKNEKEDMPISFMKHLTGYVACASGGVETIAATLAIKNRMVPSPSKNLGNAQGLNFIRSPKRLEPKKPIRALINASSLVGSAASLVIGEHENV